MKFITFSLLAFTLFNTEALALNTKQISNAITSSTELQSTLAQMGYSNEEAVAAFQTASEELEKKGDTYLGTVAICGKLDTTVTVVGIGYRICTSLTHSYEMSTSTMGLGFDLSLTANLIYFIVQDPNARKHCFTGGKAGLGWGLYGGIEALRESVCKDEDDYRDTIYLNGALGGIHFGGGGGGSIGALFVSLNMMRTY